MYVIEKEDDIFVLRDNTGERVIGYCEELDNSTWKVYIYYSEQDTLFFNSKNKAICSLIEYCLNLDIDVSVNL